VSDYKLWDEFVKTWPLDRVRRMSLEEYTKAGDKNTFTYWLEAKLSQHGSIWGGSSFKFGIFSRADTEPKESDNTRSYNQEYAWYTRDGSSPEEAFETTRRRILEVIENVAAGDIEKIDPIQLGPAFKWKIACHYQDRSRPLVLTIFLHTALASLCGEKPNSRRISHYHRLLLERMPQGTDLLDYSDSLWRKWQAISQPQPPVSEQGDLPLNTIFYGPPGTGKTYATINRALKIICRTDKELSTRIGHLLDDPRADREMLEEHFFRLVEDKRITFLTFHPSYTYEDFVHGIRPVLENGGVVYEMKDGPFKKLAEAAQTEYAPKSAHYDLPEGAQVFKMSLGNTLKPEDAEIYDYCIENGLIAHGFGNGCDFNGVVDNLDWNKGKVLIRKKLSETDLGDDNLAFATRVTWRFIREMKENDIVVISKGNYKIRAIARVNGPYRYREDPELRYNHVRSVEWIVKDADIPVEQLLTKIFSQQTLYLLKRQDIRFENLRSLLSKPDIVENPRNYVMIIDEINRGNIPRIFGELITLIEPDKRLHPNSEGRLVGYRVSLPGAGDEDVAFGVPQNLYVVATMNTADKSITTLDVALRRRFTFEPMYPKYDLIEDDDLRELVRELNGRISEMKDRDHQIGHSYLMGLAFDELDSLMNGKILPLLEEYFFGDASKVLELLHDLDLGGGSVKVSANGTLRFEARSA